MEKKRISIAGTKLSVNNTQLLISSGIPSVDDIVGGGLPVGTINLIEEDTCATYSKLMLKYYIAEGVVSDHSVYVASQDFNTTSLVSGLPAVVTTDEIISKTTTEDEKLKIAWRYQNTPTSQPKATRKFGHFYDLTKIMDTSYTDQADIKYWTPPEKLNFTTQTFNNPIFYDLLENIKKAIDDGGYCLSSSQPKRSVLRIVLQSIGSPLWVPAGYSSTLAQKRDMEIFIFCLRAIVRSALAVVVITIPSQIVDKDTVNRCIHSSDLVIRLQSFSGTELENNKALLDYQGFFHVVKLPAINTLQPKDLGPVDFAFKLRRKKFTVEELHLPPELQESSEREQDEIPSVSCGNSSKHLYEF